MAVNIKNGVPYSLPLDEAAKNPLDLDTEIDFAGTNSANATATSFKIETSCATASDEIRQTFQVEKTTRFSIAGLLPQRVFAEKDLSGLETIVCKFEIHATDSIGSTHDYTLPNVRFTNISLLEKLKVASPSPQAQALMDASATLRADTVTTLDLAPAISNERANDFDIYCDHFQNHRARVAGSSSNTVLRELVTGEIERLSSQTQTFDPRDAFTQQSCRIVVRATDPETGASDVKVTPVFNLHYPLAKHEIRTSVDFGSEANKASLFSVLRMNAGAFLTVNIRNTSSAPEAFLFRGAGNVTIQHVQFASYGANSDPARSTFTYSLPSLMPIAFDYYGDTHRTDLNGAKLFEIAPGSTLTIAMKVVGNWLCSSNNLAPMAPGTMGYAFAFDAPMTISQMKNWDAVAPLMNGETEDVSPEKIQAGLRNEVPTGWWPMPEFAGQPRPQMIAGPITNGAYGENAVHLCGVDNAFADFHL